MAIAITLPETNDHGCSVTTISLDGSLIFSTDFLLLVEE